MPLNIFYLSSSFSFPELPPSTFFFMYCSGKAVQILSEEAVSLPSIYTPTVKSFRGGIKEVGKRKVNVPSLGFSEKNFRAQGCELSGKGDLLLLHRLWYPSEGQDLKYFSFSSFPLGLLYWLILILTMGRQTSMKPDFRWILQGDAWESSPCIITLKHLKLWLCW